MYHSNELDYFTRFVSHWFTYIKDGFINIVVKIAMDQFHLTFQLLSVRTSHVRISNSVKSVTFTC